MLGPHDSLGDDDIEEIENDIIDRESDLTGEELDEYLRDVPAEADLINWNEANEYYEEDDDPTVLDMDDEDEDDGD